MALRRSCVRRWAWTRSRARSMCSGPNDRPGQAGLLGWHGRGSRRQAAGRGPVPLAEAPGRGHAVDRSRALRLARSRMLIPCVVGLMWPQVDAVDGSISQVADGLDDSLCVLEEVRARWLSVDEEAA